MKFAYVVLQQPYVLLAMASPDLLVFGKYMQNAASNVAYHFAWQYQRTKLAPTYLKSFLSSDCGHDFLRQDEGDGGVRRQLQVRRRKSSVNEL